MMASRKKLQLMNWHFLLVASIKFKKKQRALTLASNQKLNTVLYIYFVFLY